MRVTILAVAQPDFPGQDVDYGRDKTNNDIDGHAGFNFTKIDSSGNVLPVVAANWSAVLDNVTGLMWENKTDDGGLHDKDNLYTWYDPDNSKMLEMQEQVLEAPMNMSRPLMLKTSAVIMTGVCLQ